MMTATALLVIMGLASLLMLGVLGSLVRSGIAGIRASIYATVITPISLLMLAAQPLLPPSIGIVAANTLLGIGTAMYLVSVRQFFGRPVPLVPLAIAVTLECIGLILFWYVWRDFAARVVIVSAMHAILVTAVGVTIFRYRPFHRPAYPYMFALGMSLFLALSYAMRAVIYLLRFETAGSMSQSTPLHVVFMSVGVMSVPGLVLAMILMIHDRMLAERETEVNTDFLTGVLSRKAWWLLAEKTVARASRSDQRLSLLMLDIDHFKHINDTHGHLLGDAVLQHFGTLAPGVLRDEDIIGRIGGEEFAILFPDTRIDAALFASQRLLEAVREEACAFGSWAVGYTFSAGLVEWNGEESAQEMTQRADQALYRAKHNGRNGIVVGR